MIIIIIIVMIIKMMMIMMKMMMIMKMMTKILLKMIRKNIILSTLKMKTDQVNGKGKMIMKTKVGMITTMMMILTMINMKKKTILTRKKEMITTMMMMVQQKVVRNILSLQQGEWCQQNAVTAERGVLAKRRYSRESGASKTPVQQREWC